MALNLKLCVAEGTVMHNNNGDAFKVIEYVSSKEVYVRFINTGFKARGNATNVRAGRIKDKLAPTVYGIGCFGVGKYTNKHKAYKAWTSMIERCYSPKAGNYAGYGARGVTVHPDWHNYQTFAEWYEPRWFEGCQLDKDLKSTGIKQYGPDTCELLSGRVNTQISNSRKYLLRDPSGTIHEVFNLTEFAEKHGVNYWTLWDVAAGRKQTAKGWTRP